MAFHPTTTTILRNVLDEQQRDLKLFLERLKRANAGASPAAIERFHEQIAKLTASVADFERLIAYVRDENAEAAELAEARAQVSAAAHSDRMAVTAEPAPVPDFNRGDMVNVSDPQHKHWGTRGKVVGFVYDPFGIVVEYDNLGSTLMVSPSQLMHHTAFVEQESRAEFEADTMTNRDVDPEYASQTVHYTAGGWAVDERPRCSRCDSATGPEGTDGPCPWCAEVAESEAAQERFADAENAGGDF